MSRIITITLGFVPSRIWEQSLAANRNTRLLGNEQHFFINQHYPMHQELNTRRLKEICDEHRVMWLDPGENLGLARGFNWALKQIDVKDDDIVIAYDPDVNPLTPGWDVALVNALRSHHSIVWASLMSEQMRGDVEAKGYRERKTVGGMPMLEVQAPVMNSICAWKGMFLNKAGGLSEPNAFYGGLECSMWNILKANNWKWVFLPDFHEDPTFHWQQDDEYRKYKWAHAHLQSWKGDFASFLEAGCPMPKEIPAAFGRSK